MEFLKTNQKYLLRIGLLLHRNDTSQTVVRSYLINVTLSLAIVIFGCLPGIHFLCTNKNIEAWVFSLLHTSCMINIFCCYLSVVPQKRNISEIFEKIQIIRNKG